MLLTEEQHDAIMHYGILRRSGRYPWGSGGTQSARNRTFLDTIAQHRQDGMSDTQIAKLYSTETHPFTTNDLRTLRTVANAEQKQTLINTAQRLKDKGMGYSAIGRQMGQNESSIRSLLKPGADEKIKILRATAEMLKREADEKRYVDIGSGTEHSLPIFAANQQLGITSSKLNAALTLLKEDGYNVHTFKKNQVTTGLPTNYKVLVPPGVSQREAFMNADKLRFINERSEDGGRTYVGPQPPLSIKSKRIGINYKEDGGDQADGVIYVRRGVDDVSLGKSQYAQVRILVDGTHYLKGMAVYKDDMPDGVDLVFNTNKSNTGNKKDAMKAVEVDKVTGNVDPVNPFGAQIKAGGQQLATVGGKTKVKSAMNIINEEGDWDNWSKNLSTQMLSKQSPELIKDQLKMTYERKLNEYEDLTKLTNPAIKKKLLKSYSDDVDSAAVHLKAAAMPGQTTRVLMPVKSVKDTEIYAPHLENGTRVALIRYPHGGKFEIPELTVNNRNREAGKLIGKGPKVDAVGINAKVAERLSGADFDGDNVLVIPNNKGRVKSDPALDGLKDFDPRAAYPAYPGMKSISPTYMQNQMGEVSNLIADMTLRGASNDELARAVRHSMVIIDSAKHDLDYRSSAQQNGISQLRKKYQVPYTDSGKAGASTLITRGPADVTINARRPRWVSEGGPIDTKTGKLEYTPTGQTYVNRKGETKFVQEKTQRLAITDDANRLSSGTKQEQLYADHSNRLKALANTARKEMLVTKDAEFSKSAERVYSKEVAELKSALLIAKKNAPLERQAQTLARNMVADKKKAYPSMDKQDIKRVENQAIAEARYRTGAGKQRIEITPAQWNAIQAGAIKKKMSSDILDNSDLDVVKKLATPRTQLLMSSSKKARASMMFEQGFTQAEVAQALGVSLTTLKTGME